MTTLATALSGAISKTDQLRGPQLVGSFSSVGEFVASVCDIAPFLSRVINQDKAHLDRVMAADLSSGFADLMPRPVEGETSAEAMYRLRTVRKEVCLAVALCDYAGVWSVDQVIRCLSNFADACLSVALQAAWDELAARCFDKPPPLKGLSLIGMGKLGACELNYSSDIDFVAFYDADSLPVPATGRLDQKAIAVKLVQSVVSILNDRTADGIVFRTDLRLRPNPSATPVAVSLGAAETYYQRYGQTWERAAFIKARHCAGDPSTSAQFDDIRRPFIWRRTLDFGAVADIHAVKNQIHAEKGSPEIRVRDGNIKLGPGGIREVEFFAQMQQLLLGGRDATLRTPQTVGAIAALVTCGHLDRVTGDRLIEAYGLFRRIEHRLQMREDAQTHTIPDDSEIFNQVALAMGQTDPHAFEQLVLNELTFVHDTYAELFGAPEPQAGFPGSLVFTGVDDDPRTLTTLANMGFRTPEAVTSAVRRWHQGSIRATKTVRSRELLTALLPHILDSIQTLDNPDKAFSALNVFLSELPSGFQIFSLFTAHPEILGDILLLCEGAPSLVQRLGTQPGLIEALIEGFDISPAEMPNLPAEAGLEMHLDEARRLINEHRTRVSTGIVLGHTNPSVVGATLAASAEKAIQYLTSRVIEEMDVDYRNSSADMSIIAFGRLGAKALTPASDLDLVFVYEPDTEAGIGETYFNRLIRRIVSALSVPTAEGDLFEIDMKLRPSGGAGPTAVSISSFDRYYAETAWVWEEMALTKARIVYGAGSVAEKIEAVLTRTFTKKRDTEIVRQAVLDMRQRLRDEKPAKSVLDLKRADGGLTDVEFIVQYLLLCHGAEMDRLPTPIGSVIDALARHGCLDANDAKTLSQAQRTMESTIQFMRALSGAVIPAHLTKWQEAVALRAIGISDSTGSLENELDAWRARVSGLWTKYVDTPSVR